MEKQEVIKVLQKNVNELDRLLTKLLNEDLEKKRKSKKEVRQESLLDEAEQETLKGIKELLVINNLPSNDEFLKDVYKICYRNNIYKEQLEEVLRAVKRANDKSPKDDIKKYVFTCLYNVNKRTDRTQAS